MSQPFTIRRALPLLKEAVSEWMDDKALSLSAALAYYTIFSLAPLLIIVVAIVGFFWGGQSGGVRQEILSQIAGVVGQDSASFVGEILDNARRPGSGGIFATVIGVVTLLVASTAAFAQLQDSLNTIWEVKVNPDYGIKGLIRARVLSLGLILTIGFLLLVSLVLTVAISSISAFVGGGGSLEPLWQVVNTVVSLGVITLLFAMIYRYLPDVKITWHDTWVGAAITALLFVLGKLGIGLYLGSSSMGSTYGAAGSFVVLLVWIYYSSAILFLGAEITQVFARRYGSGIRPSEHAVRIVENTTAVTPDGEVQKTETHSSLPNATQPGLPPVRSNSGSTLRRLAPLAATFVIGRLTKRRKVKIEKRYIRR